MTDPTIYDYLAKYKVSELTIELLDSATKDTAITPTNLDFWRGIIAVSRVLTDSRTYPHGLPIPSTGAVQLQTIPHGNDATIKPTGTELWRVENVDADNCTIEFQDADGNLSPILLTAPAGAPYTSTWGVPFIISATLFLKFSNGSGGEQTPSIAYHKVGL